MNKDTITTLIEQEQKVLKELRQLQPLWNQVLYWNSNRMVHAMRATDVATYRARALWFRELTSKYIPINLSRYAALSMASKIVHMKKVKAHVAILELELKEAKCFLKAVNNDGFND